jgi:hypothetical protein
MQAQRIQKNHILNEIKLLAGENFSHTSMKQLMARIARRQGLWRKRMTNCHHRSGDANPALPEAA